MLEMIVFPSSYYDIKKVDEDFQVEYDAAKESNLYDIVLFHYEKWFHEERLVLDHYPSEKTFAIYRGWMMKVEQYKQFYEALLEKNIQLMTTPSQYEKMHLFPNIYEQLKEDTPKISVYVKHEKINIEEVKKIYPRFMIKDFVKSVKGTNFPKYFDQSITQEEFDQWMQVFYEYRGDLFTGGICIKEYVNLKKYQGTTNEYRVFYVNHNIATVCRNSSQATYLPSPPQKLINQYKNLDSLFYTVDYAELENGSWIIIEAGDGSVSGLSPNQDAIHFFRTLKHLM